MGGGEAVEAGLGSNVMFVVVPDYIFDEINAKLDAAIKNHPDAEADRDTLRSQLIDFVDIHGYVPDFDLAPPPTGG